MKSNFANGLRGVLAVLLFAAWAGAAKAEIVLQRLSPEQAKEMGITMKFRPNGDAGVMAWLEFRKQGVLESFSYAELRMEDAQRRHLLSAMLRPRQVTRDQSPEITSVAFSARASQLELCSFLVVTYGSRPGDIGYILQVSDFLAAAED